MESLGQAYPATFEVDRAERIANWRPLVQWLLAIPHFAILYGLQLVARAVAVISWFAILFTGKLPEGLASVAPEPGNYPPVRNGFAPELEDRNRVTVGFRLILAIPQLIVVAVLGIAAIVVWLIALFAVLFTGRWPEALRTFIVGYMRWVTRVEAYVGLLTDKYPPFSLD